MEKRVTQKIVTETKFVASDGQEFDAEWKCRNHEADLLRIAAEESLKSVKRICATNPYDSQAWDYYAACYYIQNQKEYEAMIHNFFVENLDDGEECYLDKPQEDKWKFPLWVYVDCKEDYGYDVFRAEDYINGVKQHIQELENALAKANAEG